MEFIEQIYKMTNVFNQKAVFLDRDGTVIDEVNYLFSMDQIRLLPGVTEGIKKLNKAKIAVIVVTNQPVVARGMASIDAVKKINNSMTSVLNKHGAVINAIYFCPHHPEKNHADIPKIAMQYRVECSCRKPKITMLQKAVKEFNINVKSSYIIGDRTVDIKTGSNMGIKTILVKTGYKGEDKKYLISSDYIADDFLDAVEIILNN